MEEVVEGVLRFRSRTLELGRREVVLAGPSPSLDISLHPEHNEKCFWEMKSQ